MSKLPDHHRRHRRDRLSEPARRLRRRFGHRFGQRSWRGVGPGHGRGQRKTVYAGATVEFRNMYGKELHTVTDSDGYYSIPLPDGTYSAIALDLTDWNAGFRVVGKDNVVKVPTPDDVDFVAYPVS